MKRQKHKQIALLQANATNVGNALPGITGLPKELEPKVFAAQQGRFGGAFQRVQESEASLHDARLKLRIEATSLRKMIKRVRGAVLALHGDDSQELEMVGGKRFSQRKRPVRRRKAEQAKVA